MSRTSCLGKSFDHVTSQCLVVILKCQKFDTDHFANLTNRSIYKLSWQLHKGLRKVCHRKTMQALCFSIYLVHWEVSTGNTVGAADFCRSVKCRGRIGRYGMVVFLQQLRPQQVVWRWRRCTRRGSLERRIYKKFSTCTHCANGSQSWGRPSYPMFSVVIGLSSVLAKFFYFR